MDIAFPDKQIGIEINGNQHYERNGDLKPYYKDRHNYLECMGWKIYELHYKIPYSDKILDIINNILKSSDSIYDFDYDEYIIQNLSLSQKVKKCIDCEKEIYKYSIRCPECNNKFKVKKKPSFDTLQNEIDNIGYKATGRKYGVSDNAIRKWIKSYNNF